MAAPWTSSASLPPQSLRCFPDLVVCLVGSGQLLGGQLELLSYRVLELIDPVTDLRLLVWSERPRASKTSPRSATPPQPRMSQIPVPS